MKSLISGSSLLSSTNAAHMAMLYNVNVNRHKKERLKMETEEY